MHAQRLGRAARKFYQSRVQVFASPDRYRLKINPVSRRDREQRFGAELRSGVIGVPEIRERPGRSSLRTEKPDPARSRS